MGILESSLPMQFFMTLHRIQFNTALLLLVLGGKSTTTTTTTTKPVRIPTHRHGNFGEFFADAVLHDAPQVETDIGLFLDPLPSPASEV